MENNTTDFDKNVDLKEIQPSDHVDYVGYVCIATLIDGSQKKGILYCVDPVTSSIILLIETPIKKTDLSVKSVDDPSIKPSKKPSRLRALIIFDHSLIQLAHIGKSVHSKYTTGEGLWKVPLDLRSSNSIGSKNCEEITLHHDKTFPHSCDDNINDRVRVRSKIIENLLNSNKIPWQYRIHKQPDSNEKPVFEVLSGQLLIHYPYDFDCCESTNEIILRKVQKLIRVARKV